MKMSFLKKLFNNNAIELSSHRLEAEVEKEQNSSELIISWTQLSFAIFILATWIISLFARQTKPEYEILPFVLGSYIAFSLAKISWAKRELVNEAVLGISVFVDISLVTGLIWLYHIQYNQAPGFYLKVPTFIYYFFFIAIRSLRYDMKYIFLSGFGSITAWYGLLIYALQHKDTVISKSFIEYTNSHSILIGAEIEKILGLFVVTITSALTVYRKKKLLLKSVESAANTENLTKFFSDEVAQTIQKNHETLEPGVGTTRFAAILMIDLRNFTKQTESWAPKDILNLISEYQSIVVPIILKNKGCIDKYMGDGIFAHFGAANDSHSFAADAMRTMEEIQNKCDLWNNKRESDQKDRIEIGQAMAVGNVVFGTTGDQKRLEFTTIGSTVNMTAKLEKHTKVLGVTSITTQKAMSMAQGQGYQAQLKTNLIKNNNIAGLNDPMDLITFDKNIQIKIIAS